MSAKQQNRGTRKTNIRACARESRQTNSQTQPRTCTSPVHRLAALSRKSRRRAVRPLSAWRTYQPSSGGRAPAAGARLKVHVRLHGQTHAPGRSSIKRRRFRLHLRSPGSASLILTSHSVQALLIQQPQTFLSFISLFILPGKLRPVNQCNKFHT